MTAAPVDETQRIKSLDVMRGFAVLGILPVNAAYFAAPWQTGLNPMLAPLGVDQASLWSWFGMHVLFEFKCLTLFSLLFGASLYLVGGEIGDRERGGVLLRRLLWLLVFGLIHAMFIWYGDILVTYALTGLLVMLARSWRPRSLALMGLLLLALSLLLQCVFVVIFRAMPEALLAEVRSEIWAPPAAELARVEAAFRGDWLAATRENFRTWTQFFGQGWFYIMTRTAGVMMIGLTLFKVGFLSGRAKAWAYGLVMALGAAAMAAIAAQAWINWRAGFDFRHMQTGGALVNDTLAILVSLGYASGLVLLVKAGARVVTEPLAAVGRMAFSNYLTQSLIMTSLFWGGRGLGLYGQLDRPALMGIVAAVWAVQLLWSPLWLSKFQMGPFEWVWRRLSYGRPVRFTKKPA